MSNHRAIRLLLKDLSGKDSIVTVPRLFVDLMCGELSGGVFLNQLIFWSDKGKDGWFYKPYREWETESFLSRYEINKYSNLMQEVGLLEVESRRKGRSNCLYYKPNIDKICIVIVRHLESGEDIKKMAESNFTCENLHMNDVSPVNFYTSRSTTDDSLTDESTSVGENGEDAMQEPTEENIVEWFNDRAKRQKKEVQERLPRTEDDIKQGVVSALGNWEARKGDMKPSIENYLIKLPEGVRELARVFCYHRERPPIMSGEDGMWRKDWHNQQLLGLTPDLIDMAIKYMKDKKLPIRAPASVTTIAENIKTGHISLEELSETSQSIPQIRQLSLGDESEDVDFMGNLLDEERDNPELSFDERNEGHPGHPHEYGDS